LHLLLHLLNLLHHLVDVPTSSQTGSSPKAPLICKPPSAKGSTVRLSIPYTLRRPSGERASKASGARVA
jgi:hypothetical protein